MSSSKSVQPVAKSAIEAKVMFLFFTYFSQRAHGRRKTRGDDGVALVALVMELMMVTQSNQGMGVVKQEGSDMNPGNDLLPNNHIFINQTRERSNGRCNTRMHQPTMTNEGKDTKKKYIVRQPLQPRARNRARVRIDTRNRMRARKRTRAGNPLQRVSPRRVTRTRCRPKLFKRVTNRGSQTGGNPPLWIQLGSLVK